MIVIPMAGQSSRYKAEGFDTPKYMLRLQDKTVLGSLLESVAAAAPNESYVFVIGNDNTHADFIEAHAKAAGITNFEIIRLENAGAGMLPDVTAALSQTTFSLDQPLTILPCDILRPGFTLPNFKARTLTIDRCRNQNWGSYSISSARDFRDVYEASRTPSVRARFNEKAMEIAEFLQFFARLKLLRGYSHTFRDITPDGYAHLDTPADYYAVTGALQAFNPRFPLEASDPLMASYAASASQARKKLLSIWINGFRAKYGTDDKSETYADRAYTTLKDAVAILSETQTGKLLIPDVINDFSEAVESQLPLALKLESLLKVSESEKSLQLETIGNVTHRKSALEFLCSIPPADIEASPALRDFLKHNIRMNTETACAFYNAYWSGTDEDRIESLTYLLKPERSELSFKLDLYGATPAILNAFLPPKTEGSNAYDYGKKYATSVAQSAANEDMIFILAGMIKAVHQSRTQPNSDDPDIEFGYRLKTLADAAGGAKIAQIAHSFGNTPKKWKVGLAASKSKAAPMRRAAFLKKAESLRGEIGNFKRIGTALGTGTYIDTKTVEFESDEIVKTPVLAAHHARNGLVIQLLKDGAAARSRRVFSLVVSTMRRLADTDAEAKQAIGGIIPIIEHKSNMIGDETNLDLLAIKAGIADLVISGVSVVTARAHVHFNTANVFKHGAEFRVTRRIFGNHFNLLPEGTKEEKRIKSEVAEAIVTAELMNILSGYPFNHDQHGDNNGVTIGTTHRGKLQAEVGLFDDGAIIAKPPTERQKELFANLIMDALANAAINGFNPLSSLKHIFTKMQEDSDKLGMNGQDLAYVNAMMQAVVSLGDYFTHMAPLAVARSVKAAVTSGTLDAVIKDTFMHRYANIRALQRGKTNATEAHRRARYYPAPTEDNIGFTSKTNRTIGRAALVLGPTLFGRDWPNAIMGKTVLKFPDGYLFRPIPRY